MKEQSKATVQPQILTDNSVVFNVMQERSRSDFRIQMGHMRPQGNKNHPS